MIIRPDFIFSYWIFVWFILYFTHIVTINPKLWLIIALLENIISILVISLKSKMYIIIRFIIINFFIKAIPLYLIWNTKIHSIDVVCSLLLFVIYLLWLYINNFTIYALYKMIYNSHIHNSTYTGHLSYLYDKIYNYINVKYF